MSRSFMISAAAGLAVLAIAVPASAHTMSDGHLDLVPDGDRLVGTLDVAVRDLHDAFGLDPDGDGKITWTDLGTRKDAITKYVTDHLTITSDAGRCGIKTGDLGVIDRADGTHVAVALVATCVAPATEVTVDYKLLYELDAQHRGLLHIGDGRAVARDGGGPARITVRTAVLPRLAAAVPGGVCTLTLGGAALALLLAAVILRRSSKLPLVAVLGVALVAAAAVGWALHRLVS
jgi:hypothetical protein